MGWWRLLGICFTSLSFLGSHFQQRWWEGDAWPSMRVLWHLSITCLRFRIGRYMVATQGVFLPGIKEEKALLSFSWRGARSSWLGLGWVLENRPSPHIESNLSSLNAPVNHDARWPCTINRRGAAVPASRLMLPFITVVYVWWHWLWVFGFPAICCLLSPSRESISWFMT